MEIRLKVDLECEDGENTTLVLTTEELSNWNYVEAYFPEKPEIQTITFILDDFISALKAFDEARRRINRIGR